MTFNIDDALRRISHATHMRYGLEATVVAVFTAEHGRFILAAIRDKRMVARYLAIRADASLQSRGTVVSKTYFFRMLHADAPYLLTLTMRKT